MAQKILFINQETAPYVPDSTMSTLGRKLPTSVIQSDVEVRTFMPKWGIVNERRNQLHEVIRLSGMNISINDTDHPLLIKVATIPTARVQVYFIDNSDYFKGRQMRTDEHGKEYTDNVERSIFYARGVLETVKKLRWYPDYVVCQGWISHIIPFYIRTAFKDEPAFANCKIVSFFFREQLDGQLPANLPQLIGFREGSAERLIETGIDFTKNDALIRLAAAYSDGVANVAASSDVAEAITVCKGECLKVKGLDNLSEQLTQFLARL